MLLDTIWIVALAALNVILYVYIAHAFYAMWQGDEHIVFSVHRKSPFQLEAISFDQMTLVARVPYKNVGKQNGTIMDAFVRTYLPQEQFDSISVHAYLTDEENPRTDGYWKAKIIEKGMGGHVILRLVLSAKNGNLRNDIEGFPHMNLDIVAQLVGRTDWYMTKSRLVLTPEDVQRALEA